MSAAIQTETLPAGPAPPLRPVGRRLVSDARRGSRRAVRGDLLAKVGRRGEARTELLRAAALTENVPERDLLLERAARL
jgi:predicted RNA polymerase sigma factor